MDIRWVFFLSVAVVLFTLYYLEREMEREQIFWMYAILGLVFGLTSVYTVAKNIPSYDYFLIFTGLFLLIAILYYEEGAPKIRKEEPMERPEEAKPKRKARKRKSKEKKGAEEKAPEAPVPVPESPPPTPSVPPPPVS